MQHVRCITLQLTSQSGGANSPACHIWPSYPAERKQLDGSAAMATFQRSYLLTSGDLNCELNQRLRWFLTVYFISDEDRLRYRHLAWFYFRDHRCDQWIRKRFSAMPLVCGHSSSDSRVCPTLSGGQIKSLTFIITLPVSRMLAWKRKTTFACFNRSRN